MPTIALVGRPNVGKSTLFNRLSNSRQALVADTAGLTRDRQYANAYFNDIMVNLIDTGGLTGDDNILDIAIKSQVLIALNEADIIYFLVSGKDGLTSLDSQIVKYLRQFEAVMLLINKCESGDKSLAFDFFSLGLGEPFLISAEHNIGIGELIDKTCELLPNEAEDIKSEYSSDESVSLAVLGRPNVGKSTLINKMLGKERVMTLDMPGTTRDSISTKFEKDGVNYNLIDTAGIRRKRNVHDKIEIFSILKAREAIEQTDIVLLVLDASEGVTEQDASLLGMAHDNYRSIMIIVNKWDGLNEYQKSEVKRKLDLKLSFINYASIHYISALHGSGVGKLFKRINFAYANASTRHSTSKVNKVLELANISHRAPPVAGKRLRLKYAHQSAVLPPTFIFHGNNLQKVPDSYQRFLKNIFIRELKLENTPIKLVFKTGDNPYKDKKNVLSDRQIKKKRRMMQFVKGKK